MSFRQRRFNYKVQFDFANDESSATVNAVSVDIPTYTRPVGKYISQKKGTILIPGREDPPEFTVVMDLDLDGLVDASKLNLASGGTNNVLASLNSLYDTDGDTLSVTIQMFEQINGEETVTWQVVATDCMVTSIAGDTLASNDDSEVMRCTVTFQPSEIKHLSLPNA